MLGSFFFFRYGSKRYIFKARENKDRVCVKAPLGIMSHCMDVSQLWAGPDFAPPRAVRLMESLVNIVAVAKLAAKRFSAVAETALGVSFLRILKAQDDEKKELLGDAQMLAREFVSDVRALNPQLGTAQFEKLKHEVADFRHLFLHRTIPRFQTQAQYQLLILERAMQMAIPIVKELHSLAQIPRLILPGPYFVPSRQVVERSLVDVTLQLETLRLVNPPDPLSPNTVLAFLSELKPAVAEGNSPQRAKTPSNVKSPGDRSSNQAQSRPRVPKYSGPPCRGLLRLLSSRICGSRSSSGVILT